MFINIIRWILLPFACVLAYILTGIIANFFIGGYEGETIGYSRYAYTLGSFDIYWYGLIKNALMSSALVYAAFFVAPTYKMATTRVIAIIMAVIYIGLFVYAISVLEPSFWKALGYCGDIIASCIGLLAYKTLDEEA